MNTSIRANNSFNNKIDNSQFFKQLRHFGLFFHAPDEIMKELDMIEHSYNQSNEFSQADWTRLLHILQHITNVRLNSNVISIKTRNHIEEFGSLNTALYKLGMSLIKGYLGYLREKLQKIQALPMKIATSEAILSIEDEISELTLILIEGHPHTDWKSFRVYIDDIQLRISDAIDVVNNFQEQIKIAPMPGDIDTSSIHSHIQMTREHAWKTLLDSGNTSNDSIERIKGNLKDAIPYHKATQDAIMSAKNRYPLSEGLNILNMGDIKIQKAITSVQKKEGEKATGLSVEMRNDLHRIYGTAANDEYSYNTLAETFHVSKPGEIIDLHVTGFTQFSIVSHTIQPENPLYSKLQIRYKKLGSDIQESYTIICNPDKMRAGAQTRIGILQKNGTTKIELLNINKIESSGYILPIISEKIDIKPLSKWERAKNSMSNTWNKWFSKKAA